MVLVGEIWAIAVQAGLSGYEMSLMRWVEHGCYVCVGGGGGVRHAGPLAGATRHTPSSSAPR